MSIFFKKFTEKTRLIWSSLMFLGCIWVFIPYIFWLALCREFFPSLPLLLSVINNKPLHCKCQNVCVCVWVHKYCWRTQIPLVPRLKCFSGPCHRGPRSCNNIQCNNRQDPTKIFGGNSCTYTLMHSQWSFPCWNARSPKRMVFLA